MVFVYGRSNRDLGGEKFWRDFLSWFKFFRDLGCWCLIIFIKFVGKVNCLR